jgi:hypothetical protein
MKKIIPVILFFVLCLQAYAQSGSGNEFKKAADHDDLAVLSKLNNQFFRNFLNNDTVSHNTIVYKDFICIAGNGAVINRDDYMKGWAHGYDASLYKSFVMQNEFIRIMGNTALVRAETFYTYADNGKDVSGTTIYTDTYIKLDGRWWCIQAQLTPKK